MRSVANSWKLASSGRVLSFKRYWCWCKASVPSSSWVISDSVKVQGSSLVLPFSNHSFAFEEMPRKAALAARRMLSTYIFENTIPIFHLVSRKASSHSEMLLWLVPLVVAIKCLIPRVTRFHKPVKRMDTSQRFLERRSKLRINGLDLNCSCYRLTRL